MTRTGTGRRRSAHTLPLGEWAGDSRWRQFVAWLVRTAVLATVIVAALALIWLVALPWVINGYRQIIAGPGA